MSIVVSPMASEAASPMITSVTPTLDPCAKDEGEGLGEGSSGDGLAREQDHARRQQKPPPLHTGADWKVVLHLPEIETWLRATTTRVRDLTHSVHQDAINKHVDVHLVQLKDICEDISDHVEQIHALLETEFSLKLLSYSVNIIVDIRTVQLLWHQLRVSVLVLRERLLQGLQDSNGNYTRQTNILQAFSQDHDQARLDALTEVDDSGQLTIKCSQDYFSLDCGITAFELSDYSPGEEPEGQVKGQESHSCYPGLEQDFPELIQSVGLLTVAAERLSSQHSQGSPDGESPEVIAETPENVPENPAALSEDTPESSPTSPATYRVAPQGESALSKRPLLDCFNCNDASPTQPSLPKKAMYPEGISRDDSESVLKRVPPSSSSLQFQADISRSTPSLLDPPDRSKFWLELTSVYPSAVSHSYDSLNATSKCRSRPANVDSGPLKRSSSETGQGGDHEERTTSCSRPDPAAVPLTDGRRAGEGASPPTSPTQNPPSCILPAEDRGLTSEPPDHRSLKDSVLDLPQTKVVQVLEEEGSRLSPSGSSRMSSKEERWYGSDEYLALPSQLRKTEILALKLETLAQALPHRPSEEPIQDVDDWELSEGHSDWDGGPAYQHARVYDKPFGAGRFSPTSSSDIAPSLDESIESGPLSDLLSEDEAYWNAAEAKTRDKPVWLSKSPETEESSGLHKPLIQQLLEDIQHQENDQDIWGKIEGFVGKLDEFIRWLREALESTENWTPPKAETDSLRLYLETHLSFKLNVDSHCSLKDSVLDEGSQLLEVIISHKSGLRDTLQLISQQWRELQRQIRRQHSWILRALDAIKAQILSRQPSGEALRGDAGPTGEVQWCHQEAQNDVLDQMALRLNSQQYCSGTKRKKEFAQMSKVNRMGSNSLQDFESEYQELWDWLMDMESIVTDSHDLMMSEDQQLHLYKGNSVEMAMWLPKKTQLLGRVESLLRSGAELPADFQERVGALTRKWDLLQSILGEHAEAPGPGSPARDVRSLLSPETHSMLGQLQVRIKELKAWLRDTELFIFNSCLRQDREQDQQASKQLQYFKSLCLEVRGRRRGVASVLRLCQKLLETQDSCEPESERQALQLLTVNLERRWEAIVMQALQWQTRLQRALGTEQVPGNIIEPSFMDLHSPPEDSWEWDETDISNDLISIGVESGNLEEKQSHTCKSAKGSPGRSLDVLEPNESITPRYGTSPPQSPGLTPPICRPSAYQVYSLREVELYDRPQFLLHKKGPSKPGCKQPLMKSLSKDSSFCSAESLPDLLGGIPCGKEGRGRSSGDSARRSESESGIVSEGDTETTGNSEICVLRQAGDGSTGSISSTPPPDGVESPAAGRVCDEDIDRVLERAEKLALYGSCDGRPLPDGKLRTKMAKKKRDESSERKRRPRRDPAEILVNGRYSLLESEGEELDPRAFGAVTDDERGATDRKSRKGPACASQGSSLDSLFLAGELFPSGKDTLHRSTSLESWLAPCKNEEETGSQHSLGDLGLAAESTGELSRRTLELLKRLENIQSPFAGKMTRSISDITLRSSSLRLSGPGPLSLGAPSSINESSAPSMTELSSSEDSSVGSEDMAVQRNRLADSNASFRKHCRSQVLPPPDEADASVSMVVNVSCTSACTDDEDDSDLLSSSTLTLTEEELGIKEDGDSSLASDEEYMEGGFALGLEYMKNELQNWIKPRSVTRDKGELDLVDELQCGTASRANVAAVASATTAANEKRFLSRSALKLLESNANGKSSPLQQQQVTRSSMSQFVDDLENGNVENSAKGKDEDDELMREEGSLFTKSGESFKDCYSPDSSGCGSGTSVRAAKPCDMLPLQPKASALEGQLSGEIPCHSSRRQSPLTSPASGCPGSPECTLGMPRGTHSQDHLDSFLKDGQEADEPMADQPPPPCCSRPPLLPREEEEEGEEDVHNFVMEIIDMASVALKNKETGADRDPPGSAPVSQIRDKVLEHSHRPIHLRKGDFYSYLSLSSHDSDCGEVSTCTEDKSSTPLPYDLSDTPDLHDEELLFQPCTEEVYLGPPLCYTMCMPKKQTFKFRAYPSPNTIMDGAPPPACTEYQKAPGVSPGSTAGSQLECHNEAAYLNPLPCETLIDTVECFADTKMLESNISPVMTKIRVSCSSTNPLKGEGSLYINPKINCPQIRKSDRDEKGPASQRMKQKNVRKGCSSLQEAKSTHKQSPRPERGLARDSQVPQQRGPVSGIPVSSASRSRYAVRESGTARPLAKRVSGALPLSSRPRP
ncbi:A-kinase anchor protein 6 isoform X2 [Conger conger]|uniref:A-kinase anchor protein 6 isoform X2 n=1 Tax=Conger conger TaxID=82655 RepID=UPI002A59B411|nr:A-kinase anchor protein 6 isoform X2 [Conger conger]